MGQLTREHKKNKRKAKWLERIAPICFIVFLVLAFVCLVFAVANSFGNIKEIITLLDKKGSTGAELSANYQYLIEKYGEWVIGTGGNGWTISFIDVGHALFNGLLYTNLILSAIFFVLAILSKKLLPKIAQQISENDQEKINMITLKNEEKRQGE